jgi:uncharacterized Tic20 family protein
MQSEVSREDQLAGAVCHLSILMPIFGLIIPIMVWFTQRQRSVWLRFQSLQASVYQGIGVLLYFGLTGLQIFPMFGVMAFMGFFLFISAASRGSGPGGLLGPIAGLMMVGMFVVAYLAMIGAALLQCLIGPIFTLAGVWAGWQILKGRRFRYPLLGGWIVRRFPAAPPAIQEPRPSGS